MRALIFAAGVGARLGGGQPPKSLLEFAGRSLLERHLELLRQCAIDRVVIAVGHEHELVEQALAGLKHRPRLEVIHNPDYREGNVVTLWHMREHLDQDEPVLLMDADVLYDLRLLKRLLDSPHPSCLLLDRQMEPGEEPVKVCVRQGRIVEIRKTVAPDLSYDLVGESVGFFKLDSELARRLKSTVERFATGNRREALYEEAIRDLLLADPGIAFGFEDITGLPWTEIDFHADIERALHEILPQLVDSPSNADDAA